MADQADVETALAALVANALYPAGTSAPSVTGAVYRIYRGYPTSPTLNADLAAGAVHVSVVATAGAVKNTTRYPRRWVAVSPVAATLLASLGTNSVSFSGTCLVGQLAGLAVNGATFPYAVQASDTPATVASNLAAAVRLAGWLVNYAGTTIGVPGAAMFSARVVSGAGELQEIKRQIQDFKISIWCADPAARDAAAGAIDPALAVLNFIPLADGSSARLVYAGSEPQDASADATMYRRDISYSVEYPTTLAQMTPAMLFGTAGFQANADFIVNLPN